MNRTVSGSLPFSYGLLLCSLPLVYVGTVRVGLRLIPADIMALCVFVVALAEGGSRAPRLATPIAAAAAAGLLIATTIVSTVIGLLWVTPSNVGALTGLDELVRWQGTPLQRACVELFRVGANVAAFVATLMVVTSRWRFRQAVTLYSAAAWLVSLYAIYSWGTLLAGGEWPLLPNTFANPISMRVGGTFPEPVAFSGFMLTGIVTTLWMAEFQRTHWVPAVMTAFQVMALLLSISAFGFIGFAALAAALLVQSPARLGVRIVVPAVLCLVLLLMLVPSRLVLQQTTEKVGSQAASWQDRTTAWRTAADMWRAYPVFGVGPGQFAYNQAPFFPSSSAARFRGARVNSPGLEILSEGGLISALAVLATLVSAVAGIRGIRPEAPEARGVKRIGWAACALLAVLWMGYYTSRYTFMWTFTALVVAAGAVMRDSERDGAVACAS
jgi:O-antigen ligase